MPNKHPGPRAQATPTADSVRVHKATLYYRKNEFKELAKLVGELIAAACEVDIRDSVSFPVQELVWRTVAAAGEPVTAACISHRLHSLRLGFIPLTEVTRHLIAEATAPEPKVVALTSRYRGHWATRDLALLLDWPVAKHPARCKPSKQKAQRG